jgi:quercetin 2,3-dioxygenase
MVKNRKVRSIHQSQPTLEGAGVHLRRAFGYHEVPLYDPFLLLDDFRSDRPEDYVEGFPWHPHRGIETITYMLEGSVEHGDSMGNSGVIEAGDVQWMTAGSGIIHQEMPKEGLHGRMGGFQLWANLPAAQKMMPPRYRGITSSQIPQVTTAEGAIIRIIAGQVNHIEGPVHDIVTSPEYLDIELPAGVTYNHAVDSGNNVFAYVFQGSGYFGRDHIQAGNGSLVLFDHGEQVPVQTTQDSVRFLLISGKPIGEPVAWYGPIVMNTNEELQIAINEFRDGTFIKPIPK